MSVTSAYPPSPKEGTSWSASICPGLPTRSQRTRASTHLKNNKFSNAVRRQNFAGDADREAIARWIADGSDKAPS